MGIPSVDKMTKNSYCQNKSVFRLAKGDDFPLRPLLKITISKLGKVKVKLT